MKELSQCQCKDTGSSFLHAIDNFDRLKDNAYKKNDRRKNMLKKLFGIEGSFTGAMSRLADFVLLSALWLLVSLPLITIIPSTAALYYACVKSLRKGHGTPIAEFKSFFAKNWKQGIGISILYLILGVLVGFNIYSVFHMDQSSTIYHIYIVISLWLGVLFAFLSIYLPAVFSRFEYRLMDFLKNSLIMAVRHTLTSLILCAVSAVAVFLMLRFYVLLFVFPAVLALVNSYGLEKVFRKYMIKTENEENLPWYWE